MNLNSINIDLINSWKSYAPEGLDEKTQTAWLQEGEKLLHFWQLPERKYHSLSHLALMLEQYNLDIKRFENATALYFAIWYHDAVYIPWNNNNEEMSAKWAVESLTRFGFNQEMITAVNDHIIVTKTHIGNTPDQKLMIDIDLSILGAEWDLFYQYEQDIRYEYSFVPEPLFKEGRKQVLNSFLKRTAIYNNSDYVMKFEKQARQNIRRSIELLDSKN